MINDLLSESSHAEDANDVLWARRSVVSNIKGSTQEEKRRDAKGFRCLNA